MGDINAGLRHEDLDEHGRRRAELTDDVGAVLENLPVEAKRSIGQLRLGNLLL